MKVRHYITQFLRDFFLKERCYEVTPPTITQGEKPADCTITITSDDFQKLYESPAAGMQLFFAGKLKIAGNQMLGMKLQKLFSFK